MLQLEELDFSVEGGGDFYTARSGDGEKGRGESRGAREDLDPNLVDESDAPLISS